MNYDIGYNQKAKKNNIILFPIMYLFSSYNILCRKEDPFDNYTPAELLTRLESIDAVFHQE